jgi:hypothetical protein
MKILYKFPSRERPYKFFNAVDNIIAQAQHKNYQIMATLDLDDDMMTTKDVKEKLDSYGDVLKPIFGMSGGKVDAINRDMYLSGEWDVMMLMSDDFYISKPGFDVAVLDEYRKGFSGLLHFPDQVAGARLCTFPIMDFQYFKRFNFVYHPGFKSVYADNWQYDVAKLLGCYKFMDLPYLEHRHHMWGYGPADDLLKRTEHPLVYHQDMVFYEQQKSVNFDLHKYQ